MDIDLIRQKALKYDNRTQFRLEDSTAYSYANRYGILDEVCSHMEIKGHKYRRFIYAFEFPDNHVYVGLTYNLSKRELQHYTNEESAVFKHIEKTKLKPIFIKIVKEPLDIENAIIKENITLKDYESKGWKKLNRSKTGSVGGNFLKWTIESLQEEALRYNSIKSFQKEGKGAYAAAVRLGVLYDICSHMEKIKETVGFWNNKENCLNESKKYKNRSQFKKAKPGAFEGSVRNGWLEEFFPNKRQTKPRGYWDDYNNFKQELDLFGSRQDLKKNNESAYNAGRRNKWFE